MSTNSIKSHSSVVNSSQWKSAKFKVDNDGNQYVLIKSNISEVTLLIGRNGLTLQL